jgi:hypothetical protein
MILGGDMEARTQDAARREFEAELERLLAGAGASGPEAADRGGDGSDADVAERLDALILAGLVSP